MKELTRIRQATEKFFSVKLDRSRKTADVVLARQCAVHYLAVKYRLDVGWGANISWITIARTCGVTSHGTAIHHYKKMKGYLEFDVETKQLYKEYIVFLQS
jgi:chromosomal replication initiation ATPase DnaA